MSSKSERKAARASVEACHEAQLSELVARVGDVIDRYRAGELDVFETDLAVLQYSRAAKELWKFCTLGEVGFTASVISAGPPADWWERGAPTSR